MILLQKFIRVECVDTNTMEPQGGYMCALMAVLRIALKVSPTIPDDELAKIMNETDSPAAKMVISLLAELGDIPHPNVYIEDKANHVCLYRINEFEEAMDSLLELEDLVYEVTQEKLGIYLKVFELESDELLYEDPYQVVISKETYNEKIDEHPHIPMELAPAFMDELYDEMYEDGDDEWDDDEE